MRFTNNLLIYSGWVFLLIATWFFPHMQLTYIGLVRTRELWQETWVIHMKVIVLVVLLHAQLVVAFVRSQNWSLGLAATGVIASWIPYPFTYLFAFWFFLTVAIASGIASRVAAKQSKPPQVWVMLALPPLLLLVSLFGIFFDT